MHACTMKFGNSRVTARRWCTGTNYWEILLCIVTGLASERIKEGPLLQEGSKNCDGDDWIMVLVVCCRASERDVHR